MFTLRNPFLNILLVALLAHLCLFTALPPLFQTIATLVLTGLLPGWLLGRLLVGDSSAPPEPPEQVLYALGAGYSHMVIVTLLLSYLPGDLTWWQALLGFDGVLLILLVVVWGRGANRLSSPPAPRPLIASLLLLLLVAGCLRFANLGYAEFHGDEARAILRAAAVVQGYEDVLFLHKKGPTEILLPTVILALTGQINELTARLPFAIAGLATLLAVFVLGQQLLGPLAGWVAAFLLAFDGYFIAFARFVQYQSIVLLLSVLAVLIAWRLLRHGSAESSAELTRSLAERPQAMMRYLLLLAIFVATGLLSHYDMLAVGVALGFLLGALLWQQIKLAPALLRAALPALLVGVGLVALFYVPFVLHPRFQTTSTYLIEERFVADGAFPYNNLVDVFQRSVVYSSPYLVLLFVVLVTVALVAAYRRGFSAPLGTLLGGLTVAVVTLLYWRPDWLSFQGIDLTVVPVFLLLTAIWLAPRLSGTDRLLWLWFGAPLLVALFFTAHARTHVYIFFVPWALLVGDVLAHGWRWLAQRGGQTLAVATGGLAVVICTLLVGKFAYANFVSIPGDKLRTTNSSVGVDSLYGFPFTNGWKVIGALYKQGVLQGGYETNQRYDWIPGWYTRGQHRCGSTATWYFAVDRLEPWMPDRREIADGLEAEGYRPWGIVAVADAERIIIYQQTGGAPVKQVQRFRLDDYTAAFDQQAHSDLPLTYPVVEATRITHPLHVNFADQIWLQGYDLEYRAPLKAGDRFRLTLYWQAQRLIDEPYTVFTQAYYGNGVMVAQKDSTPVCAREPTIGWTPGRLITDVYDITVAPDAPAGVYPLYVGLYHTENLARLPVLDAAGAPVDQQVQIADLRVE